MAQKIQIIRKGVTEKFDGMAPISNFIFNDTNQRMYGKYEEDHVINIQQSIIKNGLKNPIVLYKDGKTVKSGHNRLKALLLMGVEEVPYIVSTEEKPESILTEMISLAIENMGRPANMGRSYFSVKQMIEVSMKEHNGFEPKTDEIKSYCSYHQISYDSFVRLKKLEIEAPDLFDKVIKGTMSISAALKELDIRGQSIVKLSQSPFMNGLIGLGEINYALGAVTSVINKIQSITVMKPGGVEGKAFEDFQKNTMGAIVHELFTNAIRDIVNYMKRDRVLEAPKNQKLYDLEAINYNSGIETKTCVTKNGKNPKWVSHRYKDGYVLLLSLSPNGKRAMAGYGIIDGNCWQPGMSVGTLKLKELAKLETFNWVIGSLDIDNGEVVAIHDPIQL